MFYVSPFTIHVHVCQPYRKFNTWSPSLFLICFTFNEAGLVKCLEYFYQSNAWDLTGEVQDGP